MIINLTLKKIWINEFENNEVKVVYLTLYKNP